MNATDLKKKYGYSAIGEQLKKILASDATTGDKFGYSIAISDTRIVVGAPYEDTTASDAGSAYIFDINGSSLDKYKLVMLRQMIGLVGQLQCQVIG